MFDKYFKPENKDQRSKELRRLGRTLGGYALGGAALSLGAAGITAASPIGAVVGVGLGVGSMYASREVMRPLYQNEESDEAARSESRLKRFGRGVMYAGGMALKFVSVSMIANAIFPGADNSLSGGERLLVGGVGAALFYPGDKLMEASYNPELFGQAEQAEPETSAA